MKPNIIRRGLRKFIKDEKGYECELVDSGKIKIFGWIINEYRMNIKKLLRASIEECPDKFIGTIIITRKLFIYRLKRVIN